MKNSFAWFIPFTLAIVACNPSIGDGLRKKDLRKDVELVTTRGTITIRLSDSTPLHRNNFLKLVKLRYYDSILFHRVIRNFMIQAGDPRTRHNIARQPAGNADHGYTIPAEFRPGLFHQRGVIAAARTSDDVNPQKASSGSQFYIVQGRIFTDHELDSVETFRLKGAKLPAAHREVYKTIGGTPQLDQQYTVFGKVVKGMSVVDSIAAAPTSGSQAGNRPTTEIRILKARLLGRKI